MRSFETSSAAIAGADPSATAAHAPSLFAPGFVMAFGRNEEIYGQQEPADFVYRVVSGVVRTCRALSDGRRQIISFCYPGDVFGLESGPEHSFCAEAVGDCQVALTKRRLLEWAADQDNTTARDLWALTARDLQSLSDHMLLLGRKGAVERVAAFLLQAFDRTQSEQLDLPMSRTDIADYLGLTIESVSRSMTQLERERVIALPSARHVELCDRRALRAYDC